MSIRSLIPALVVLALSPGCLSTLRVCENVSDDPAEPVYESLPGLPFYGKREVFRQTTTVQERWRLVTVEAETAPDRWKPLARKRVALHGDLSVLHAVVSAYDGSGLAYQHVVDSFAQLPTWSPVRESVSNELVAVLVPDASRPYYLNAVLPWFGSASVTGELADDGTLSKATAEGETGLTGILSEILPLLPISMTDEPLEGVMLVDPDGGQTLRVQGPRDLRVVERIEGQQFSYRYDHPGPVGGPLPDLSIDRTLPVSVTRRALGAAKSSGDPKKTVKVSGNVVLP